MTLKTIKGMVYNNCTDSGLANVTVYLNINDGKSTSARQTVSDHNGSFSFDGVSIHSSSKYSYAIYIPSKSGEQATTPEYCGFNGTTLNFNYDEANMFFKPRVTPKYLYFSLIFNQSVISLASDSVYVNYKQQIFHKNVPTLPYNLYSKSFGTTQNESGTISNYPMGKWNITIEKWKSGVYTIQQDSIYLGWGSTSTYTINW